MEGFSTLKGPLPWPWIGSYCIPSVVHHSSTSTYMPYFIEIEGTFCGWTDGETDGRTFETGFIRSTLSKSRPKTINWPASVCDGRPAMRCSRFSAPCSHAAAETDCCWPSPVPHATKLPPSAWRPSYDSNLQQWSCPTHPVVPRFSLVQHDLRVN